MEPSVGHLHARPAHVVFSMYKPRETDQDCAICLEKIEARRETVAHDPRHLFHRDCLKEWATKQGTHGALTLCPVCKTPAELPLSLAERTVAYVSPFVNTALLGTLGTVELGALAFAVVAGGAVGGLSHGTEASLGATIGAGAFAGGGFIVKILGKGSLVGLVLGATITARAFGAGTMGAISATVGATAAAVSALSGVDLLENRLHLSIEQKKEVNAGRGGALLGAVVGTVGSKVAMGKTEVLPIFVTAYVTAVIASSVYGALQRRNT